MRDEFGSPGTGEPYAYLTEFAAGAWHGLEHPALDKTALAREIPASVCDILALQERPLPDPDPLRAG